MRLHEESVLVAYVWLGGAKGGLLGGLHLFGQVVYERLLGGAC